MEELTSAVRHNAEHTLQADTLARNASSTASRGGTVIREVVSTMDEIKESARKIADITAVIDSIAFQTNILALNAAVEAARAGEQGRGFAVVATEVRALAQRCAGAAKEIKLLIGESVQKVEGGVRQVSTAGTTMDDIVASVRQVTAVISEISSAGREQAAGIEQVNSAVAQMDEITQHNASMVEEAAAAAQSLQIQASALAQLVARFRLERMPHVPPAPAGGAARLAASAAARGGTSDPALRLA